MATESRVAYPAHDSDARIGAAMSCEAHGSVTSRSSKQARRGPRRSRGRRGRFRPNSARPVAIRRALAGRDSEGGGRERKERFGMGVERVRTYSDDRLEAVLACRT